MSNKFLEQADKDWERNGLLVEKAILLLNRIRNGNEVTDEEIDECLTGLLTTLMTDTPSGMFGSAFTSMIEGRLEK